tara:strand:+ start:27158 stop:27937 length:780 start_codon:yes stop_codon:yes gene_type:complete
MAIDVVNKILHMDVLDGLKQIPNDMVSLVVTSPPYNVGIDYAEHDDEMAHEEYLDWMGKVWAECYRVLRPGGRLCVNIDMTANMGDRSQEYYRPLYADFVNLNRKNDFMFRTEIAWYKQNLVGSATAWGSYGSCSNPIIRRNHEYVLVWSKGDYRLEGDKEKCDLTDKEFQQWTMSMWFIQPETRKRGKHHVPYPEELVRRLVKLYCYQDDIVLDPFMGTGTTAAVAKKLRRKYIGIDNDIDSVEYARSRVACALDVFA